jgi:hypothetical protein
MDLIGIALALRAVGVARLIAGCLFGRKPLGVSAGIGAKATSGKNHAGSAES